MPKDGKASLDDNLIIHGDNLHALKALLPKYAGKVKCIYIDPPYNTGNEGWCYNDNLNAPLIREWLKDSANPVDKEDLERHDKWLCMMWPRLRLLKELLSEEGVIFVSIDDNEIHNLKCVADELFGDRNWVGTIVWKNATDNNPTNVAMEHEYIVCFARNKELIENVWKSHSSDIKEKLVELLIAMGYGGTSEEAGRAIGQSGDDGVDGVIDQDPLGVDQIYLQVKRYREGNNIGAAAIRDFFGALSLKKAHKGIFVTTSMFSPPSVQTARDLGSRIVLIDGVQLTKLMIRYNIGCRDEEVLHLKRVDEDFFEVT